jgi:hypothetical protein
MLIRPLRMLQSGQLPRMGAGRGSSFGGSPTNATATAVVVPKKTSAKFFGSSFKDKGDKTEYDLLATSEGDLGGVGGAPQPPSSPTRAKSGSAQLFTVIETPPAQLAVAPPSEMNKSVEASTAPLVKLQPKTPSIKEVPKKSLSEKDKSVELGGMNGGHEAVL